jgi:hypothetical protein
MFKHVVVGFISKCKFCLSEHLLENFWFDQATVWSRSVKISDIHDGEGDWVRNVRLVLLLCELNPTKLTYCCVNYILQNWPIAGSNESNKCCLYWCFIKHTNTNRPTRLSGALYYLEPPSTPHTL